MHRKENRLHMKLYITIVFSVVLAITLTSTSLYINFQSILMRNEYKNKLEKMESEAERISKLSDMALNTLYQIYNDLSVKKLLSSRELDAFEENAAFIQLRYYLANITDVDSIYVYNVYNNRIYTVTNEADLVRPWNKDYDEKSETFYDQSAVEMIENHQEYAPFIPVPRFYPVNDKYTKCVYTYIMYDTFGKSNRSNVVLLNFETSYLFQEENETPYSDSLIVDQNNQVIHSNSKQYPVKEYLNNLLETKVTDPGQSGYFMANLKGVKSVVMYSAADSHHWRYISIIEYNTLLAQVRRLQTITVVVSFLIAFVGILISHLFSKRVTVPVRAMSMDIKSLESEKRKTENIERNKKLIELLEGGGFGIKERQKRVEELLYQYGIETTKEKSLFILCICLDEFNSLQDKWSVKELQVYKFSAVNILSELIEDKTKTCWLDIAGDKALILAVVDEEITREYLEPGINRMKSLMKEYYDISISTVLSQREKELNKIFSQYEEVKKAVARKIFWQEGAAIYLPESEIKQIEEYEYPETKEKNLAECLMLGKAEKAIEIFEEIIIETYSYPIVIYNMMINRLIVAIDNIIQLLKRNGSMQQLTGYVSLLNILEETDTLRVRNERFHELFNQIQTELEKKKSEKHDLIIDKINQIIDRKYEDSSFSLEQLADAIGMSTAYMCRLYKQYTGSTIMDILINKRMEKAKELLNSTNLTVNEIALMTGYSNPSYFHRAFKKVNGITPNEYRKI